MLYIYMLNCFLLFSTDIYSLSYQLLQYIQCYTVFKLP